LLAPLAGNARRGQVSAARARRRLQDLDRHHIPLETAAAETGVPADRLRQVRDGLIAQIGAGEDTAIASLDLAAMATGKVRRRTPAKPGMAQRWRRRYDRLAGWAREQGHARPPAGLVIEGIRIGGWVTEQRHQWRRGRMAPQRAELLEALPGWAWQVSENGW